MIQIFKSIFPYIGINVQNYLEKFEFLLSFAKYRVNLHPFENQEYYLNDQFMRYFHFWLPYHILIFSSTCVDVKVHSEQINAELALFNAEKRMF